MISSNTLIQNNFLSKRYSPLATVLCIALAKESIMFLFPKKPLVVLSCL